MLAMLLFGIMVGVIGYLFLAAMPYFATKISLTEYSAADWTSIAKRVLPAFAIFILTYLVWSLGQHFGYL